MRLKAFLVVISILAVGIFNNNSSLAIGPDDPVSEKYLIDHGHSQEIVRMINLQRTRAEGKAIASPRGSNPWKKFLKNLWYEQDLSMPTNDFGYDDIRTVETQKDLKVPKQVAEPVNEHFVVPIKEFMESKKNVQSNEININDVKVK